MSRLAVATASELETFCVERGLSSANERDHLAKCCKAVAVDLTAQLPEPRPALFPFGFGDRHGWIGLGGVDVVFRWTTRAPTFLELKCGSGTSALRPCVWDAVKLATAVLGGNASSAYMLAGARAPASVWSARCAGAELFDSGEWETTGPDIRERFRSDWTFGRGRELPMCRVACQPRFAPSPVARCRLRSVECHGRYVSRASRRLAIARPTGPGIYHLAGRLHEAQREPLPVRSSAMTRQPR
jgi:hypothetical protein